MINQFSTTQYIPLGFAQAFMQSKTRATKIIKLEIADGRQWEVTCRITQANCTLGKGWIVFARDYGLEIGDVCVYEISPSNHEVFKVQVAKKSQIKAGGYFS